MNQNSGPLNQNLNQDSNSKINESGQLIEMENSNEQQVQKSWQEKEKFRELELLNIDQQRQIDLLKNSLRDANELLSQKNQIIENYQIFEQQVGIEKTQQQRAFQDLNNSILQLKQDQPDLEDQVNILNNELRKLQIINEKNNLQQELMTKSQQVDGTQNQINKLKNEIKDEASKYKKEIQELIDKKQKMQEELDKEHRNFLGATDEIVSKNKLITQLNEKIRDLEDLQENQLRAFRQKNNELKESQLALEDLKYLNQQQQNQIEQLHKTELKLREFLNSKNKVSESQLENELKKFQEQSDNILRQIELDLEYQSAKIDQEKEKLRKKMEDEKIAFENKQKMLAQEEGQQNKNRLQQAQKNLDEAKKEQGQLDVCFLVDVTGSMENYKDQTKQSVMGALQIIKKSVNRETNWAAICYQDIAEKKQLKGKYHEFPFSKDSAQLQKWFDTVQCDGGGDGAEDVKGAIEQMNNLKWPSKFRIAILICDAPCHGHKYHKGITSDDYPQDEIKPAIEKMIELGITFIGLNFTKSTKTMYEEFKKIFADKKKEDVFLYQDLQNLSKGDMSAQMVKYLGEASQNVTHTNKRQKKSKNENQNVVVRNKDGAMEALCRAGNFYNFENDEKIKCCDTKFKVLNVEIKQDAFDKNIQTIEKITVPRDYQVTEEGTWDCIRTEKPFAFGMMKDFFLMKKKQGGNMELYVIKTPIGSKPYTSLNDALTECRSHLICQKLMKKFREQLIQKAEDKGIQRKFPPIIYSDFLILQESMNSFWIAERFFNGELVKYNNNFGFIESDINDLNKMAQAFSFYTYFISDFNYMVSDVQGVGIYFTDPAINTKDGKFDDTDMGLEGQQMYLVSYELKKDILSKELLEILDMYV